MYTTWADDDYIEPYFGIDCTNSLRSGLSMYEAKNDIKDAGATIPVCYDPCYYIGVVCAVGYKRLMGDTEDHPIVDLEGDENQLFAGFAIIYAFQQKKRTLMMSKMLSVCFDEFHRSNPAAPLSLVLGLGCLVGKTKIRSFKMGSISGVLFVGLLNCKGS